MKQKISKKALREFGFLIGIGFPLFIGWIIPAFSGHGFSIWTLWIGISGLILGIISPYMLLYPYKCWMKIGEVLSWINSHIILGLVFIIILLPIALILRVKGYDPLRKRRKGKHTYRENRQGTSTDLTRIF